MPPLDILSRVETLEILETDKPEEPGVAESVVTVTVAAFTVLFVSSVAVVMYFA